MSLSLHLTLTTLPSAACLRFANKRTIFFLLLEIFFLHFFTKESQPLPRSRILKSFDITQWIRLSFQLNKKDWIRPPSSLLIHSDCHHLFGSCYQNLLAKKKPNRIAIMTVMFPTCVGSSCHSLILWLDSIRPFSPLTLVFKCSMSLRTTLQVGGGDLNLPL